MTKERNGAGTQGIDNAILIKRVFSLNVPEFMQLETLPKIA
jgi:hypothetical protein